MTRSLLVGILLLVLGAQGAPVHAQEDDACWLLCTPELEIEPTVSVEPLFRSADVRNLQTGAVTSADPSATFEIVLALGLPTTIPRVGLTGEVIWSPFADTDANPFTGRSADELGVDAIDDNPVELEFELNLMLLTAEETGGWAEAHFDIIDQLSPAEQPDDTRLYTHKLNFELDASVAPFHRFELETVPVHGSGDSGDDVAVWLHPTDLSRSTVIGTDSKNGVAVYNLSGDELFFHEDGATGMVDVRYHFPLQNGASIDIVAAGNLASNRIVLYGVRADTRNLVDLSARSIRPELTIYGTCMYHSAGTGEYSVFVTSEKGEVEQWRLLESKEGKVDARRVRRFTLNPEGPDADYTIEGCVADDQLGRLYLAQEDAGRIWRVNAEPANSQINRYLVDKPQSEGGHTVADVEGLALYHGEDGAGYLMASNQGNHAYTVYSRNDANEYLMSFEITGSDSVDAVQSDDSIEITNLGLGSVFPNGMIVVEDGQNTAPGSAGNDNYKFVRWEEVANLPSSPLTTDSSWDPRQPGTNP